MNSLKSVLFVFQMPETEDNIEIETQSMNTETSILVKIQRIGIKRLTSLFGGKTTHPGFQF